MPADLSTDEARRRAHAAMRAWGCPRPDKHHYLTEQNAAAGLDRAAHMHGDLDPTTNVYRCACGGWVWGRRPKETT